jgi:hypothetical protein
MKTCAVILAGIFTLGLMSNTLGLTEMNKVRVTQSHDSPFCMKKSTSGLCHKCLVLKNCNEEELNAFKKCCEMVK